MLEWDAASFNDSVREHMRAMNQLKNSISSLQHSSTPDAIRERVRLRDQAAELEQGFLLRAQRFWFGSEEGE